MWVFEGCTLTVRRNAMITGCVYGGLKYEALRLFSRMCRDGCSPSEVTFASLLGCCGELLEVKFSRGVNGFVVKAGLMGNVILGSALVDVYGKCGEIGDSRRMFDEIRCKNDVSWNVIVRRYLEVGDDTQAVFMFFRAVREGVKPLSFTFSNALVACCGRHAFVEGVQIHGHAMKCGFCDDEKVATSLINMYMKCNDVVSARRMFDLLTHKDLLSWTCIVSGYAMAGRFVEAEELFNEMPEQSNVSWNAMLAGYVHFGRWDEALNFTFMMCQETNIIDAVTLNLMLNVAAGLLDIKIGKQVHAYIYRHGFESDIPVSNELVDMYEKCAATRTSKKRAARYTMHPRK